MPKVPYAAYLRVYEPLAAFPEPERSEWAEYARRAELPGVQDELRSALRAVVATPPRVAPARESGDAFVTWLDGVLCVCPWRTRLRSWQALGEVGHWLMPQSVVDAALPPSVRRRASDDYTSWRERNPDARPWIRSALWHVPVRWFVLFADDEREFREAPQRPAEGAARLRYRTPMVQARRRVARGLRAVREAMPEGPMVAALTEVGRWLEEFHPRSLVELDYGGLVYTISEDQLAADHSAAEVTEGLGALAAGDLERAQRIYEGLTDRWMAVRERQFAN
ncbi:hypothetical protein FH609_020710 [Streptomyces sp. 3MP-14]|uniref:DUF8083 domain-containing protein n=1 Tax=Streptomyces mimosae TaxID=2586635 RepID=A0A5N6A1I9_9ACTN|nr:MULTISPECIES: hypothetical protein [Streptomyces]KAB8161736.1 hypothetical protein FH607_023710 [Streptomyces mimosae]KAB8174996.1 hypothetical protein FH609_020710 [Streptomyces sp. 3MP-14]